MREIRQSGSEGGAESSIFAPTPIYSPVRRAGNPEYNVPAACRDAIERHRPCTIALRSEWRTFSPHFRFWLYPALRTGLWDFGPLGLVRDAA